MEIEDLVRSIEGYTLTGPERCRAMVRALEKINRDGTVGDIVECGVWRGGNIMLARKVCPDRVCWLYDTFSGMTRPGPEDTRQSGARASDEFARRKAAGEVWCFADLSDVETGLMDAGVFDRTKLRFVIGDVLTTLAVKSNLPGKIALLRLDTDWYASTRLELEMLYPRLSAGGVLIVDDYGHWLGARRAFDEYFAARPVTFEWIDYTAIMVIKP